MSNTTNPTSAICTDEPDLHDGKLLGLKITKEKILQLDCIDVFGTNWNILIPKIERLRATNFLEGNIIFEINFYQGSNCPPNLVKELFGYTEDEPNNYFKGSMSDIKKRNLILVEMTSSYGCELLALSSAERSSIKFNHN